MKLRITGTKLECEKFIERLKYYNNVISISKFYPNNRKNKFSEDGRIYIELSSQFDKNLLEETELPF